MARETKLKIFAVNVAMHAPHKAERYVELMKAVYKAKRVVASRGVNGLLVGELAAFDKNDWTKGMIGEIYRFVRIDPNDPWFNLENKEQADEDDLRNLSIPEHLKPQLVRFPFVFFPKGHRMYVVSHFQGQALGPATAEKFLSDIFSFPEIVKNWEVEVSVEPDRDGVDSILQMHELHNLHIEIFRPNADDHDQEERELLERMEEQGAKKLVIDLASGRTGELTPNKETKTLARIGASNGKVIGSGRDEHDAPKVLSTKDIPWVEPVFYDSRVQTMYEALRQGATDMHKKIMGR